MNWTFVVVRNNLVEQIKVFQIFGRALNIQIILFVALMMILLIKTRNQLVF